MSDGFYMKLRVPEYCLVVVNIRKNGLSTDFILF